MHAHSWHFPGWCYETFYSSCSFCATLLPYLLWRQKQKELVVKRSRGGKPKAPIAFGDLVAFQVKRQRDATEASQQPNVGSATSIHAVLGSTAGSELSTGPAWAADALKLRVEDVLHTRATRLSHLPPTEISYDECMAMIRGYSTVLCKRRPWSAEQAELFSRRSTLFACVGMYDEALQDAKMAIILDPYYTMGYYRAGAVHFELKEYMKAAEYFMSVSGGVRKRARAGWMMSECVKNVSIRRAFKPIQPTSHYMQHYEPQLAMPLPGETMEGVKTRGTNGANTKGA